MSTKIDELEHTTRQMMEPLPTIHKAIAGLIVKALLISLRELEQRITTLERRKP